MATFRFYDVINGDDTIVAIDRQSTTISVRYLSGDVETYRGTFVYSGDNIVGGVTTSYALTHNGLPIFTIDGMNVSSAALYTAIVTDNTANFMNLVFGGNDEIWGSNFGDAITGHTGADTIIALDGNDSVLGGSGNDDVNGNVGQDIVLGEAGDDWVRGGKDNDTISGGDGNDPHVNGNIGNDLVFGDAGNDSVYGGQGADTLYGGTGNDLLSGDIGDDVLYGEAGADRFVLRAGAGIDVAMDFNASQGDRVEIQGTTNLTYGTVNGNVAYELSDGSRIVLVGVTDASQAASWVVFA